MLDLKKKNTNCHNIGLFQLLRFVQYNRFFFFNKLKKCYWNMLDFRQNMYKKNYYFLFLYVKNLNFFNIFVYFKVNFLIKEYLHLKFLKSIKVKVNFFCFKLIKLYYQIFWFNLHTLFAKYIIIFTLKNIFFKSVYRDVFLYNKINIYFFETKKIEFLTATLVSGYIVRNLKVGHNLNRIIYPLLRTLERAKLYNGWKIGCSGRFKRRGRAQRSWFGRQGVALNTITSNIDFAQQIIRLRNGICCVKVFLSRKNKYIYVL